jgi:hypothetical protein
MLINWFSVDERIVLLEWNPKNYYPFIWSFHWTLSEPVVSRSRTHILFLLRSILILSSYLGQGLPGGLFTFAVLITCYRSRDCIVGIATSYGLDDQGVGVRVPVLQIVQTGSEVHPTSYLMGTGFSFPGG